MKMEKVNVLVGTGCIGVSVYLYWITFSFPPPLQPKAPGPAFFPRLCLGAIIVFSLWILAEALLHKREEGETVRFKTKRFLVAAGMVALYLLLLPRLGFLLTGFLYLSAALSMRMVNRLRALMLSAGLVVALYLLFDVLLNISLPGFSVFKL